MEDVTPMLVYLKRGNSPPQPAKFTQDITEQFSSGHEDKAVVNCGLEGRQLVISDQPFRGSSRLQLRRLPFCPFKNMTPDLTDPQPDQTEDRGVEVVVVILLQTASKKFLLTRRSKTLSLLPNVWALPGGHMEPGENLLECGLRELWEETHLDLRNETPPLRIVELWEFQVSFPVCLRKGHYIRHYIVPILLVTSSHTHQELQAKILLNKREVSACTWLDAEMTERIVGAQQGVEDSGKQLTPSPACVRITEMSGDSLHQKDMDTSIFLNTAAVDGDGAEYLSAGTRYALEIGLTTLQTSHLLM